MTPSDNGTDRFITFLSYVIFGLAGLVGALITRELMHWLK